MRVSCHLRLPLYLAPHMGSVLGPLWALLFTAELGQVVTAHGLTLHQHADDCQVYLTTSVSDAPASVSRFTCCVDDVAAWMSASRLRLNPTNTEVLWLGFKYQVHTIPIQYVPDRSVNLSQSGHTAHDLVVDIERLLTVSDHFAAVCRAAYFRLYTPDHSFT